MGTLCWCSSTSLQFLFFSPAIGGSCSPGNVCGSCTHPPKTGNWKWKPCPFNRKVTFTISLHLTWNSKFLFLPHLFGNRGNISHWKDKSSAYLWSLCFSSWQSRHVSRSHVSQNNFSGSCLWMSQNTGFCVDMPTVSEDSDESENKETNMFHRHNFHPKTKTIPAIDIYCTLSSYYINNIHYSRVNKWLSYYLYSTTWRHLFLLAYGVIPGKLDPLVGFDTRYTQELDTLHAVTRRLCVVITAHTHLWSGEEKDFWGRNLLRVDNNKSSSGRDT